jgi:hypothetical protein
MFMQVLVDTLYSGEGNYRCDIQKRGSFCIADYASGTP